MAFEYILCVIGYQKHFKRFMGDLWAIYIKVCDGGTALNIEG